MVGLAPSLYSNLGGRVINIQLVYIQGDAKGSGHHLCDDRKCCQNFSTIYFLILEHLKYL